MQNDSTALLSQGMAHLKVGIMEKKIIMKQRLLYQRSLQTLMNIMLHTLLRGFADIKVVYNKVVSFLNSDTLSFAVTGNVFCVVHRENSYYFSIMSCVAFCLCLSQIRALNSCLYYYILDI